MNKKKCFVIMPFSKTTDDHTEEYWTDFYTIIERIMTENHYHCTRSEVGPYKLFSHIVENISESDVVVAVLTDFNANVFYELGIRHTLKSGTLMLMEAGQTAPFDIKDFGIIFYKDSINVEGKLKEEIKKYLDKMDIGTCDSPVLFCSQNIGNAGKNGTEKLNSYTGQPVKTDCGDRFSESESVVWKNKILWVDDCPENNEAVIKLFEQRNVQFDKAVSTEQGIQLYKKNRYDAVITDMGRDRESDAGLTLITRLNNLRCEIPIIVYASYTAVQKYGEQARRMGAHRVIYGQKKLISEIYDLMKLW